MSSSSVIAVLGAGPGLGMSMAHRFGREGFAVALVSRSARRHPGYRAALAAEGIDARTYAADVTDPAQLAGVVERIGADLGPIDTLYFGPATPDAAPAVEFTLDLDPPEITDELRAYAPTFTPGRPLIEVVCELSHRIYTDFTYRSGSTTVSTRVSEVLAAREGVCQDFARLLIACLRANGLAASYVSGYLATDPPPGKERMVGIDATHAWAAVWTPGNRWLGVDPTNDQLVDERYITVGFGRDYADIPPLRGIIYTNSDHSEIEVGVDVTPEEGQAANA